MLLLRRPGVHSSLYAAVQLNFIRPLQNKQWQSSPPSSRRRRQSSKGVVATMLRSSDKSVLDGRSPSVRPAMVKSSGGSGQKQNLCYRPTHDQTTRRRTQRSGQCRRTLWGPCGHAMPWATGFLPLPKNLANKQTASNDDTRTCLENEMEIGDTAAAVG